MTSIYSPFKHPENDQIKVWRYMDISKFLHLIQNRCLYFSRIDKLEDKFEGSVLELPSSTKNLLDSSVLEENRRWYSKTSTQKTRGKTFVNCWHMNDHESNSMWKVYGADNRAICIQSTFRKLFNTFQKNQQKDLQQKYHAFGVGEVKYINYDNDFMRRDDIIEPFMHKRMFFQEEQEIRALIFDPMNKEEQIGLNIPIDINKLIENVYVHPQSPKWVHEIILNITKQYELNIPIAQSSLSKQPIYSIT